MERKVNKLIYWTPRILSILFIIFLALMSLDVITPGLSIGKILLGLLMHNIPAIILLIVVIVSWKYEIVGGIAFLLSGFLYIIFSAKAGIPWYLVLAWSLQISGISFIIGGMFLYNWIKKKQ